jgi:hypothetical protein
LAFHTLGRNDDENALVIIALSGNAGKNFEKRVEKRKEFMLIR